MLDKLGEGDKSEHGEGGGFWSVEQSDGVKQEAKWEFRRLALPVEVSAVIEPSERR